MPEADASPAHSKRSRSTDPELSMQQSRPKRANPFTPHVDAAALAKANGAAPNGAPAVCEKENVVVPWHKQPLKVYRPYGWQCDVVDIVRKEPDDRTIHWFWSEKGSRGKSSMVRYLAILEDALVCSGKDADIKYLIVQTKKATRRDPRLIVFDVPRSSAQFLSYTGMEEVKGGIFCSTKYECGMHMQNPPHVLVFANFPPDMNDRDMSSDRFVVQNVDYESECAGGTES